MADKFSRRLNFNTVGTTARVSYFLKMMYEFWGYCVFGGASTTSPGSGAFAATTPTGGSLPNNFLGIATTIAVGSNGASLPQATINVASASTAGFPTSGTIYVQTSAGTQTVTYTGTTTTSFTGCSGGIGTMSTGGNVTSSSLMTFGSDGYTNATTIFRVDGYTDFYSNSGNFTSNMVGKQLVMWKPASNSSEDSIYNIIGYKDPNNIVINVNNGGTPSIVDGYRPSVTTRSSINYRVIDVESAGTTGIADGNFIVFQLDPTGVNSGQANPQILFQIANTNLRLDYRISPNGSWNGSAFGADAQALSQPNSGTSTSQLVNSSNGSRYGMNMFADKNYFIVWGKAHDQGAFGFNFHIEIPDRIYAQSADLNPFTASINGYNSTNVFLSNSTTYGHSGGFFMRDSGGTYRQHTTLTKSLAGDGNVWNPTLLSTAPNVIGNNLADLNSQINSPMGVVLNSPGLLCCNVLNQFSLSRCRLRNVVFTGTALPSFTRFRANGRDWIYFSQGVALPWDKTILPFNMFT